MSSGDLTPDNSDLGTSDLLGSTVNESNALTKVELGILGGVDTLNADQGDVGVGNVLAALVGNVLSLNVD